jgi:transcriptional regulator with XRE-family HTH domain
VSYQLKIDPKKRTAGRFIGRVRDELIKAFLAEKADHKVTQEKIAKALGVHRSVVNRYLKDGSNLTLRSVAELAWALDREVVFELRKPSVSFGMNNLPISPREVQAVPVSSHVHAYNSQSNGCPTVLSWHEEHEKEIALR